MENIIGQIEFDFESNFEIFGQTGIINITFLNLINNIIENNENFEENQIYLEVALVIDFLPIKTKFDATSDLVEAELQNIFINKLDIINNYYFNNENE